MEFRLIYEGKIKANGDAKEKHRLRRYFHPQLKELWNHPPLDSYKELLTLTPREKKLSVLRQVGNFQFAPLVTKDLKLFSKINILLLRPQEPGKIVISGDIDNLVKTIFDALRYPKELQELPSASCKPEPDETPFFCLLEDDDLITSVSITTDRLLRYDNPKKLHIIIHIETKQAMITCGNMGII